MSVTIERPSTAVPTPVHPYANREAETLTHTTLYTVADWMAFEQDKKRKQELRNGVFVEMAGAAYEHNAITGDFYVELSVALRGTNCNTLPSDQKIYVDNTNGFYSDIVVVCGEPMVTPQQALQNPVLIVEVLGPSTAADDRGEKFEKYRTIMTLQHYLLVKQHRPSVEHFQKGENGLWSLVAEHHTIKETLVVKLNDTTLVIPLTAIYRRIEFLTTERE